MIVVMKSGSTQGQIDHVINLVREMGLKEHVIVGTERTVIAVIGNDRLKDKSKLETVEGVDKVMPVLAPYKMASRVRRLYNEKRSGADVVVIEVAPGAAIVVMAWMLDQASCAGMETGPPQISAEALVDLHRLLTEHGFRGSFPDDSGVVQEVCNERHVTADGNFQANTSAQHGVGFDGIDRDKPGRARRRNRLFGASPDGGCRRGDRGERR